MKFTISFRLEKSVCDSLDKIKIKEKISRTDAIDKILKLGLEEYFKENKTGESEKIEKKLAPKFDEIQKNFESLSGQMKDLSTQTMGVDLKSYRMNIFLTDFVREYFQDNDKFTSFNNNILDKMDEYKKHIQHISKLGIIALKYVEGISNRKIPAQFCDEIKAAHLAMINEKQDQS
jgi:metal-responsive CopG/Arc/MetJ family transcriptional regulator